MQPQTRQQVVQPLATSSIQVQTRHIPQPQSYPMTQAHSRTMTQTRHIPQPQSYPLPQTQSCPMTQQTHSRQNPQTQMYPMTQAHSRTMTQSRQIPQPQAVLPPPIRNVEAIPTHFQSLSGSIREQSHVGSGLIREPSHAGSIPSLAGSGRNRETNLSFSSDTSWAEAPEFVPRSAAQGSF